MKKFLLAIALVFCASSSFADDVWLKSLETATPQEGYELAIKMSRMGVKSTQSDMEVLKKGRKKYAKDPNSLTAASQVIAINFQTVAAANDYWKSE